MQLRSRKLNENDGESKRPVRVRERKYRPGLAVAYVLAVTALFCWIEKVESGMNGIKVGKRTLGTAAKATLRAEFRRAILCIVRERQR